MTLGKNPGKKLSAVPFTLEMSHLQRAIPRHRTEPRPRCAAPLLRTIWLNRGPELAAIEMQRAFSRGSYE
jgi:hypothetical protein